MFRKIITYFLILAVVLPVLAAAVPFGAPSQAYARTATPVYDSTGKLLYYETTYYNKTQDTITRREYEGASGAGRVEEEYFDSNGMRQWRQAKYSNADTSYEEYEWQTLAGAKADFNEEFSDIKENVNQEGKKFDYTSDNQVGNPCGFWHVTAGSGSVGECLSYAGVFIMYEFVMRISIWIAGLASDLFNVSIQFSLTGETFDADKNIMIKEGWAFVRDLLNLVFIFILLFAAISTILQYGNMDIKKLLPSLIVVALLVNFSMMISKMVIDASHIFAWEFYNQIDVTDGGNVPNIKSSINVEGNFGKKNLANVFIAGFNPQRLLVGGGMLEEGKEDVDVKKMSPWKQVLANAMDKGEGLISTLWRMAIIILLESALALFAAFILLAGAIMFIARVVILWMVIIFSPIAFLGIILPRMDKYSKMWWEYLINQSFFAPAFLFMFMLATKFIDSKLINSLLRITPNDDSKIATGLSMGEIVLIFFNFLVVGFIMSMCLVVAKQLGGKTAEFGISWAHKGKGLALGGAKKLAWSPTRYGLRLGGGWLADKTLDEEKGWGKKRWAKTLTSIPGVGIGLRSLGVMKKADEDKARKAAEKYAGTLSSAGRTSLDQDKERGLLGRLAYGGGVSKATREGYEKVIAKKRADEYEEKKYRKNLAILARITDDVNSSGIVVKTKEDKVKGMINRGEEEILDKAIEKTGEKISGYVEKAFKLIDKRIREISGDLEVEKSNLYKAINDGKTPAEVQPIRDAIVDLEGKKAKINGVKAILNEKKTERENIEKAVEKYEAKQDTEKLGAKFSSSGAGGGGGKGGGGGGGGGKTTP